jgi:hypothetical protein
MAQTVCVIIDAEDRGHLTAVIGDRNRPLNRHRHQEFLSFWARSSVSYRPAS